jgi:hypothetical protein
MKVKTKIFILVFTFIMCASYSQILVITTVKTGRNSAQSEALYKKVEEITTKIVEALEKKDTNKAQYYFDYWADELGAEAINVNFYLLRAQMYEITGNLKAAKRAYLRAYKKHGCYECKEKADLLP